MKKGSTVSRGTFPSETTPAKRNTEAHQPDETASRFIRDNFKPEDRLAVVALSKRNGAVVQRLAPAEKIASEDSQTWLRYMNGKGYEVYISMNTLHDNARGRTKEDIAEIRHVYLDLDQGGSEALNRLLARSDLPAPNYVVLTSPEKYQVIWKVEGFTADRAEALQRGLAREVGADPAATDISRVLRLPGFHNRKYAEPYYVSVERQSEAIHRPEHFPDVATIEQKERSDVEHSRAHPNSTRRAPGRLSQSERDWAYARRALSRGEPREEVIAAIASYRRFDKHNPEYYATHTVEKAEKSLERGKSDGADRTMSRNH